MKIEIQSATKIIGNNKVLDDITMTLEGGNIYGFTGHNGSGKTMLIRAICGLMKLSEGSIVFSDKADIGLLIENIGLYPDLSAFDNLKLLAKIRKKISDDKIRETIALVGLDPEDKRPLKKYSLGMRQRAALAQALMEDPEVLLLDEPTNSLDADGMEIVREQIRLFRKRGSIVVIAGHNKEDINRLCDVVYKFDSGHADIVSREELT